MLRSTVRRTAIAVLAVALLQTAPRRAEAAPDPVIASMLSVGGTVLPVGTSAGLLLFGRGKAEGIRFDVGLGALAVGTVIGPSIGQIYGEGGVDAVVTFVLRLITSSIMTAGAGLSLRGDGGAEDAGNALFVLGGIPTVVLAVWDIFGAASSARAARYREGHVSASDALLMCPNPIPCQ